MIFTRRLAEAMSFRLPGFHLQASGGQLDPATVEKLPAAIRSAVFFGISHAVDGVFVWAVPSAAVVFMLALLIREIPLRGRSEPAAGPVTDQEPEFAS